MKLLALSLFLSLGFFSKAQQLFPRYESNSNEKTSISINEATVIDYADSISNSLFLGLVQQAFETAKVLSKLKSNEIKSVKYAKNDKYYTDVKNKLQFYFFERYNKLSKSNKKLFIKIINRELGYPVFDVLKMFKKLEGCKISKLSATLKGIPLGKKYDAAKNAELEKKLLAINPAKE